MSFLEYKLELSTTNPLEIEILSAELFALGCDSLVDEGKCLKVYFAESLFNEQLTESLEELSGRYGFKLSHLLLEDKNWNEEWEKEFKPVVVEGVCYVRAPFHPEDPSVVNLVIEPKMSFGTGHHETTWLMLSEMSNLIFMNKHVLDMGSGTGVLAIFAAKQGANLADAIDIDPWAYENCIENIARNQTPQVKPFLGDASLLGNVQYDIILANINRNILLKDMKIYSSILKDGGSLLVSGFFYYEVDLIQEEANKYQLVMQSWKSKNDWAVAVFIKE